MGLSFNTQFLNLILNGKNMLKLGKSLDNYKF